jgi:DNA end-binding protein Ku
MKSIWNPIISICGLTFSCNMFSALTSTKIPLELVDVRDLAKIRFLKVNEITGEVVPPEFIGKALRMDDGIKLVPQNILNALTPVNSKEIIFENFVNISDLPHSKVEKFYWLLPSAKSETNYLMAFRALTELQVFGISTAVFMGCNHQVALGFLNDTLILYVLNFEHQVQHLEKPDLQKSELKDNAAALALKNFMLNTLKHPGLVKIKDKYNDDLLSLLQSDAPVSTPSD